MTTQENPSSKAAAFAELGVLYTEFPHPVVDGQAVKKYPDGTQVVMGSYKSGEVDTLAVNISFQDGGVSFEVTKNGLVNFSIGKRQEVSLRSHLYPRPGEDLRIKFNDPAEEAKIRTPLLAFREAAISLVQWVRDIDFNQQYTLPPVSIVEK